MSDNHIEKAVTTAFLLGYVRHDEKAFNDLYGDMAADCHLEPDDVGEPITDASVVAWRTRVIKSLMPGKSSAQYFTHVYHTPRDG